MSQQLAVSILGILTFIAIYYFLKLKLCERANRALAAEASTERSNAAALRAERDSLQAEKDTMAAEAERAQERHIKHHANQLTAVLEDDVWFSPRPVMNVGESRVFYATRRALDECGLRSWHVFPQVSLGQMVSVDGHKKWLSNRAHQSINSKRCDMVIADNRGNPRIVVEYQGSGHYQGDAADRDTIKKIAVTRAGIKYLEIADRTSDQDILRKTVEMIRCPT